jgi:RNA polymerase sigma-70 factor (ECF subfamily)
VPNRGEAVTDAEIMARSRTDPSCFALVFDRYFATIHRYVARRAGTHVADDLAGEVFRIAFERRDTFDPQQDSARPWLYGIATNLLHGQRRAEERRLRALERAVAESLVPVAVDAFDHAGERVDAMAAAARIAWSMAQLPPVDRDTLTLFAVEGLTYFEVAGALAVRVGTVRSRIHRARCRLRELLRADGQRENDWSDAEAHGSG